MKAYVLDELIEHQKVVTDTIEYLSDDIAGACELVKQTFTAGGKILLAGNGGSAADCQHIAAEFTGRFRSNRRPLPAIALTTDTSALTAIANDFGFDYIFERQLEALAKPGDLLIAISCSGKSENIILAVHKAKELGCSIVSFTGQGGNTLKRISDCSLVVPSKDTARIQELHTLIGHILCGSIESLT